MKPRLPEVKLFGATGTAEGEDIVESEPQRGLCCLTVPMHPKSSKHSEPHTNLNANTSSLWPRLTQRCSLCQSTSFGTLGHLHHGWSPRLASGQVQPADTYQGTKTTSSQQSAPFQSLLLTRPWVQLILNCNHYAFNINSNGNMSYLQGATGARSSSLGRP